MRRPDFWQRDGTAARLLDPLGRIYGRLGRLRRARARPWAAPVPVICIGNLTVGGTGKTPLVVEVVRRLAAGGRTPHVLSRGYGGRERGPLLVDPERHDAGAVGDEPLLLARAAPTWVGRDRKETARAAMAAGADVLVMDDGFQNPSLRQDLALVVVDGSTGFGNGRLLPAGPLREPVADGLRRAGAIVIVGADEAGLERRLPPGLPCLRGRLRPVPESAPLGGRRVLAFAGIGRPDKFYRTVEEHGALVVERQDFPDHHRFRRAELIDLLERAGRHRALPLTTAKDMVRIPPDLRPRFQVLEVDLIVEPPAALDALLASVLTSRAITSA